MRKTLLAKLACVALVSFCGSQLHAQRTGDGAVHRIPPAGVTISDDDRKELKAGVDQLGSEIDGLRDALRRQPALLDLLPDVQIYHNAVRYALTYNEFFKADEVAKARTLLKEGFGRAAELKDGKPTWPHAAGLVVRGYVSKIDGSVQPYGLVLPASVAQDSERPRRLDIWYHGRGETLSEINFLSDRERNKGDFTPADTIVLHPYGRYCNGNRFAGEVDTFEALASVKKRYGVDSNRITDRGFSMGGAACWMFATHYADQWAVAAPGAGFTETIDFLHIRDLSAIPWYQQILWRQYDSTNLALNLLNLPVVAYSGEIDAQKQAADRMADALKQIGVTLTHIIGPKTRHAYEPIAKLEVARRVDAIAAIGRNPAPSQVHLTTYTLRYNTMYWLAIDSMEHEWEKAIAEARVTDQGIDVTSKNVTALSINFGPGLCPLSESQDWKISVDHRPVATARPSSDRSLEVHLRKTADGWEPESRTETQGLRKMHGLQGPIDDAFCDSFIMVKPTGQAASEAVGQWTTTEMAHAIEHWRRQFRGEARVKDDTAISDADIASSNLILWGDPSSNAILKKIADRLPIKWDSDAVRVGDKSYPASSHLPILIYPNPLNPKHYVVLNSGFTFRESAYLNNAMQTPKLPDWAVVDITSPPTSLEPGKIEDANFFDEDWKLTTRRPGAGD